MTKLTTKQKDAFLKQHEEVLAECLDKIRRYIAVQDVRVPAKFNGRLSSTMGRAQFHLFSGYLVEYSSKLYALATPEKIRNNMIHEICHVIGHRISGRMAHDRTWKRLMVICGEAPQRCYQATEANFGENTEKVLAAKKARRRGKRHRMACGCVMGPVQYKRIQSGSVKSYRCRHGIITKTTLQVKETI